MLAAPLCAFRENQAPPENRLQQSSRQEIGLIAMHVRIQHMIHVIGSAQKEKSAAEVGV